MDLFFDAVAWVAACTNLLHELTHWQMVCATGGAMRLGNTRVSQEAKQETQRQEAALRGWSHTRAAVIQIGVA
jgi:hypothetical protein